VKTRLEDLAVFGGPPAFAEPLHVGRPALGERRALLARLESVFERQWLTNDGPCVRELEQRLAARLGVRHCVAVANGTLGLAIVARALGLSGEVVVPAFTFVATAHAFAWLGLTPVFADVDPRTGTLDPDEAEALVTPRTTAIVGVHLWGRACDVERLTALARRRRLALLFDAAHAFGCSYGGRPLGGFGDAEVFSFHATKPFHTVEGGAIATNDAALAARVRLMRNFGFAGYDRVVSLGINGKLNELSAAVGLTMLERFDELVDINRRNYDRYRAALAGVPGLELLAYDEGERSSYAWIVVRVDPAAAGLDRDVLVELLHAEGVLARRYFAPGCHRAAPYSATPPRRPLPVTERLAAETLALPTGPTVDPPAIDTIAGLLRLAVAHAPALARVRRPPEEAAARR
jgi:dTDP-4-amino-4,6-dideoxygalactose transaminase